MTRTDDLNADWDAHPDAVRALAASIAPVEPSPELKTRLLAALPPADRVVPNLPGIKIRLADDADFRPTRLPGVSVRMLHVDARNRQFTCLVRMAPGATLPSHPHDGPEECIVLNGEIVAHGVRMKAGDYQRVEPGTAHAEQHTDTGCLLYLTGPASLLAE
ncbi:MAG: cupin domain-containing protein [Gemmataceae bacterium]